MNQIPDGVWPTMVTPFTLRNEIDYNGLEQMMEWYVRHGAAGLFAVCQSSEMFYLSLEERVRLAQFVKRSAGSRLPVIASGHISDTVRDQIEEIKRIADTGIDAFVLVTNRLAEPGQSDEVWKRNVETVLNACPGIPFGLYECPYPYKRLLSPDLLSWCASTGRFLFLKDTSCDTVSIGEKLDAIRGSDLKLFNANSATLLDSLRAGAAGFSGVMANFHPDLYAWLCRNWNADPEKAEEIQSFLGAFSVFELQMYPVNAKYHMQLEGIGITTLCRSRDSSQFTPSRQLEVRHLHALWKFVKRRIRYGE